MVPFCSSVSITISQKKKNNVVTKCAKYFIVRGKVNQ